MPQSHLVHDNARNESLTMTKLEELEARITAIEARIGALAAAPKGPGAKPMGMNIDDPKWGDPEIRYVSKKWTGANMVGRRFSQCPIDFLEFHAADLDRSAAYKENTGDEQKVKYAAMDRRDAAKARAWAERLRSQGYPVDALDTEELPF